MLSDILIAVGVGVLCIAALLFLFVVWWVGRPRHYTVHRDDRHFR
jgi:hypothetical protein